MGSVGVLVPHGAIAQDEVNDFARAFEEYRRRSNGRVVLDFGNITFLDSAGLETLWDFADRQRDAGQSLKVAAIPELCREILELTGVSDELDLFDSTESAVRSFM